MFSERGKVYLLTALTAKQKRTSYAKIKFHPISFFIAYIEPNCICQCYFPSALTAIDLFTGMETDPQPLFREKKNLFLLVTQINKCCVTLGFPPLRDLPQETIIHTAFRQKYSFMQSLLAMLFLYPPLCFQLFLPNILPQQIPRATLRIYLLWVRFCFNQTVF